MSKFDELEQKIRHYRWLKDIADNYQNMIELIDREKEYYTVYEISYAARGDISIFKVNPHRPIPNKYILEGLKEALNNINNEMELYKNELKDLL